MAVADDFSRPTPTPPAYDRQPPQEAQARVEDGADLAAGHRFREPPDAGNVLAEPSARRHDEVYRAALAGNAPV